MIYILKCKNSNVTDYYLQCVKKMFEYNGYEATLFDKENYAINRNKDIIFVSRCLDFVSFYYRGYRNIFLWEQGLEPEESYIRNHSIIRKKVLEIIEKLALKKALGTIFVSNEMMVHLENKYDISLSEKSMIMPCFNTTIEKACFFESGKYKVNNFCYVGSLSKWQCFSETVCIYKQLTKILSNCKLHIYTSEQEKAKNILDNLGIENYFIGFVKPEQLKNELKKMKYGFVLREDILLNRVSTPTKISSYMASGVIPIFSDCIKDFSKQTENMKYVINVKSFKVDNDYELIYKNIDATSIYEEYYNFFENYYSIENYIKKSKNWIGRILQ